MKQNIDKAARAEQAAMRRQMRRILAEAAERCDRARNGLKLLHGSQQSNKGMAILATLSLNSMRDDMEAAARKIADIAGQGRK